MKNSTNRETGSVLKTMEKIATSFATSGNDSTDSGGPLSMMLLMQQQMSQQQQMQQFQSMQQLQMQQFQQSMQHQMQAMERWAKRSEKLLNMFMKSKPPKKRKRADMEVGVERSSSSDEDSSIGSNDSD